MIVKNYVASTRLETLGREFTQHDYPPTFLTFDGKNLENVGTEKTRKPLGTNDFRVWRSGRDSNPRAAFDDNTISSQDEYAEIRKPLV